MDKAKIYSSGSYPFPLSFYNFGTPLGYLQYPDTTEKHLSLENKPSFSIDSLLARKCSDGRFADEAAQTSKRNESVCYRNAENQCSQIQQRFHPYHHYFPNSTNFEQENAELRGTLKNFLKI